MKLHSKNQLHWFAAGYKIIAEKYVNQLASEAFAEIMDDGSLAAVERIPEKESSNSLMTLVTKSNMAPEREKEDRALRRAAKELKKKIEMRDRKRDRAKWRMGLNLYKAGSYFDAIKVLEFICSGGSLGQKEIEAGREGDIDPRSDCHLIAARCCYYLYLQTQSHYHLEAGYRHYRNCVETMGADLFTMIKLPKVLFEFAKLLEAYGAFESALELYSKILSGYPNFRGYFDAVYRSAVVGKHLVDFIDDPKEKEEMVNKCVDIFQFLLEAVPPSINEVNCIFS